MRNDKASQDTDWECRNPQGVRGEQKWSSQRPGWGAQTEEGRREMIELRNMAIQSVWEAVPRGQNISKVFRECQGRDETPTKWLERLRRSLQIYSGTDPNSPVREILFCCAVVGRHTEET